MDNYIRVRIITALPGQKDLLVGMLSEHSYDGFEEEQMVLNAFIIEQAYDEKLLDQILGPLQITYTSTLIPATNWNAEWEQNFQPVVVDQFCCIRASFHKPVPGVEHDIIITPKMSFGTGHHATTYLVMKRMKDIAFTGLSVLDFGTGTGVLAILAGKLGAGTISAIDNDDWSIENAAENIAENGCGQISLKREDTIPGTGRFDVILANINRHVLLDNMEKMAQHLEADGVLIMSGLLTGDKTLISEAADRSGLVLISETERDGWIALELIHK